MTLGVRTTRGTPGQSMTTVGSFYSISSSSASRDETYSDKEETVGINDDAHAILLLGQ